MQRGYWKPTWNGKHCRRRSRPIHSPRRGIVKEAIDQAGRVQMPLSVEGLVEMARSSLSTFAMEVGLKVAECLLEDEVQRHCGPRHDRPGRRTATRYGHQRGYVTIGGQKLVIGKPRVRSTTGGGEVDLETYRLLQSPDSSMPRAASGASGGTAR